jgi:hypothetical protein
VLDAGRAEDEALIAVVREEISISQPREAV